jgi:hypothetical protein
MKVFNIHVNDMADWSRNLCRPNKITYLINLYFKTLSEIIDAVLVIVIR